MYICTILCSNTNLHCTRLTGGQIPHCNGCGWHWSTPTTSFSATFAFTEATFAFPLTAPQIAIKGMVNYQSSVVHSPSHWIDIIWKVFVCLQTILSAKKHIWSKNFSGGLAEQHVHTSCMYDSEQINLSILQYHPVVQPTPLFVTLTTVCWRHKKAHMASLFPTPTSQ